MKRVIVTGASGFVGRNLVKRLLESGVAVSAVVRNPSSIEDLLQWGKLEIVTASFENYDQLATLVSGRDYDVLYHLAWAGVYGKEERQDYALQLRSVKGSCDAVKAAAALGCRKFVYSGTIRQYETHDKDSFDGEDPKDINFYALCKDMAETLCWAIAAKERIRFCTGLVALGYGEGSMPEMLPNLLIRQLMENKAPRLMEADKRYELVYIDDIVEAFIAIGEKGQPGKTYYIGHRDIRTFGQLITAIRDIVNPGVELEFGSYPDSYDVDYSRIDTETLYNDTGFQCKADFRESIIKTMEWVKKQAQ